MSNLPTGPDITENFGPGSQLVRVAPLPYDGMADVQASTAAYSECARPPPLPMVGGPVLPVRVGSQTLAEEEDGHGPLIHGPAGDRALVGTIQGGPSEEPDLLANDSGDELNVAPEAELVQEFSLSAEELALFKDAQVDPVPPPAAAKAAKKRVGGKRPVSDLPLESLYTLDDRDAGQHVKWVASDSDEYQTYYDQGQIISDLAWANSVCSMFHDQMAIRFGVDLYPRGRRGKKGGKRGPDADALRSLLAMVAAVKAGAPEEEVAAQHQSGDPQPVPPPSPGDEHTPEKEKGAGAAAVDVGAPQKNPALRQLVIKLPKLDLSSLPVAEKKGSQGTEKIKQNSRSQLAPPPPAVESVVVVPKKERFRIDRSYLRKSSALTSSSHSKSPSRRSATRRSPLRSSSRRSPSAPDRHRSRHHSPVRSRSNRRGRSPSPRRGRSPTSRARPWSPRWHRRSPSASRGRLCLYRSPSRPAARTESRRVDKTSKPTPGGLNLETLTVTVTGDQPHSLAPVKTRLGPQDQRLTPAATLRSRPNLPKPDKSYEECGNIIGNVKGTIDKGGFVYLYNHNPQQFAQHRTAVKAAAAAAAGLPPPKKKANPGSKGTKESRNERRARSRARQRAIETGEVPYYVVDPLHPNNREMKFAPSSTVTSGGLSDTGDVEMPEV